MRLSLHGKYVPGLTSKVMLATLVAYLIQEFKSVVSGRNISSTKPAFEVCD